MPREPPEEERIRIEDVEAPRPKGKRHVAKSRPPGPVVAELASRRDLGARVVHATLGSDEEAPEIVIEPERYRRALKTARTKGQIMREGKIERFKVKSQSGGGSYTVEEEGRVWTCTCPDASQTRPCKHALAILLHLAILPYPLEAPPAPKPPASTAREPEPTDWNAYLKAEKSLGENLPRLARRLFSLLPEPPASQIGRPRIPQADSLLCALLWSINQKNARVEQATRDRLFEEGLISRRVSGCEVSRTLMDKRTTQLLEEALKLSREPFASVDPDASPFTLQVTGDTFAVDSTGFTPSRRGRWNTEKHGGSAAGPIPWLKAHLMISTKTHLITSARITGNTGEGSGDSKQFAPLLKETAGAFPVGYVVGDGSYAFKDAVNLVRHVGGEPFFPMREDANPKGGGGRAWGDLIAFFRTQRPAFDAIYHRRSVIESVNSAIKRRFGESLRSRTQTSRVNELLCKLVAHNLVVIVQQVHFLGAEDDWLDRIL